MNERRAGPEGGSNSYNLCEAGPYPRVSFNATVTGGFGHGGAVQVDPGFLQVTPACFQGLSTLESKT